MVALMSGCMQVGTSRAKVLDRMANTAVARFAQENTGLQALLDASPGYLVAAHTGMNIPVIEGGFGEGVVVDNSRGERTYVKVGRLDMAGGTGANSFKVLLIFADPDDLGKAREGEWAWSAADGGEGREVYVYADGRPTTRYALEAIGMSAYRMAERTDYWIFSGR
jgi:hypothetical protein